MITWKMIQKQKKHDLFIEFMAYAIIYLLGGILSILTVYRLWELLVLRG